MAYVICFFEKLTLTRRIFFLGCGILLLAPLLYRLLRSRIPIGLGTDTKVGDKKVFLIGGVFLSVLTGIWIPISVIHSSPQEFVDMVYFYHPLWYVVSSCCLAFGTFVIWLGVFYWLAKPSTRYYFDLLIWIFSGVAVLDAIFYGKNTGLLTSSLIYENGLVFAGSLQLGNLVAVSIVAVLFCLIFHCRRKRVLEVLMVCILAMVILSAVHMVQINDSVKIVKAYDVENQNISEYTLSRNGKNVVVLMLDRAMGEYVPYLFREKPELKKQFSGFVYYANTVSFGAHTNFGLSPIYGGYEYTPEQMNRRSDEPLVSKHNEALKVMPVLFDQNGFQVTVCNPVYANYQWIPDLSIYDGYPGIKSSCGFVTGRKDRTSVQLWVQGNTRNFFFYGILKSVPLCLQRFVYNGGSYYQASKNSIQMTSSAFTATGINSGYIATHQELESLVNVLHVTEDEVNTCFIMASNITHNPTMLQEPEYTPAQHVDNTAYEARYRNRFTLDGRTLKMETDSQMMHYQTNMATLLLLGKWFDYLRENGVYDNTRIILVSDHGERLMHYNDYVHENGEDLSCYYPLLMVKDFGSVEFTVSEEFMTNGDVPALAMDGLIEDPRNPFTGKTIDSSAKKDPVQYVFGSHDWDIGTNNGNVFLPGRWYSVHDDMRDRNNWEVVAEDAILPEE